MPVPLGVSLGLGLGGSLAGALIGGRKPEFGLSAQDITNLINAYRQSGLEGLRTLGQREQQNAVARLAASGLEPSLAIQQGLFAPIFSQLASARTGLEGQLAGTEANLQLARAQFEAGAGQQANQNLASFFSGIGDIGGLFAINSLFNSPASSGAGQSFFGQFSNPFTGTRNTSPFGIR